MKRWSVNGLALLKDYKNVNEQQQDVQQADP